MRESEEDSAQLAKLLEPATKNIKLLIEMLKDLDEKLKAKKPTTKEIFEQIFEGRGGA